jgi:chemotaxis protein methyltransferase CheR
MSIPPGLEQERSISASEFAWIQRFLLERTGIELKPGKEAMVMGRLDRRLRHHELPTYTDYFRMLGSGADPLEERTAIDLLTTNETYFFREPSHFELLRQIAASSNGPGTFRVWSAASSTGEEAWTIAMTLADSLPVGKGWEIVGTDISSRVLETARRAMYPIEAAQKIPRHLLQAYCLRGRDEYDGFLAISRELRDRVKFRHANLLDLPADLGTFDIVFLRNVMIYFGIETKRDVVGRVEHLLRPGGHLVVSHSETLNGLQTGLRVVRPSVYRAGDGDA